MVVDIEVLWDTKVHDLSSKFIMQQDQHAKDSQQLFNYDFGRGRLAFDVEKNPSPTQMASTCFLSASDG